MVRIGVLGAGVVGLSTATRIQQCLPNAEVTIIADKFTTETTSHGAGGIFLPTYKVHHKTPRDRLRKWAETSFEYYRTLITGPEAGEAGGIIMTGVFLTKEPFPDPLYKDIVFSYRQLSDIELRKLNNDPIYKYGYQVTTLVMYQGNYLPWLAERFRNRGGNIVKRKIQNLSELVGVYDVVVNCTGLGSKDLLNDDNLHPIRGHLIRVKAPWIKQWIYTDDLTFIMPGEHLVVLGGFKQMDRNDTEVILSETEEILARCKKLVPSLKDAEMDHEWIGLRPGRDEIRVTKETIKFKNGNLKVVHNYGHSANGIALSWGTAVDAAELTIQSLREHASKL